MYVVHGERFVFICCTDENYPLLNCVVTHSLAALVLIKSNKIKYYIILRPTVDQRAGQLCLLHIRITKTEKNSTKT